MKCPHCGQEHPEEFEFCPKTGKKIGQVTEVLEFLACTNEVCADYGKHVLPSDSKFCPTCGKSIQKEIKEVVEFVVNGVPFRLIGCKHGEFIMGDHINNGKEAPLHKVILTEDFYIGEFPVTNQLWEAVMQEGLDMCDPWHPKDRLEWEDCTKFIHRLNELTGENFRLPTEAEWEFAARGGVKSKGYKYSGGNNIFDVSWCQYNSGHLSKTVGQKCPNELLIYDMSGNVCEWCNDWYTEDVETMGTIDPRGPQNGIGHVNRGGCSGSMDDEALTVYHRSGLKSHEFFTSYLFMGFRLALSAI